jgi:hypothetical protein
MHQMQHVQSILLSGESEGREGTAYMHDKMEDTASEAMVECGGTPDHASDARYCDCKVA